MKRKFTRKRSAKRYRKRSTFKKRRGFKKSKYDSDYGAKCTLSVPIIMSATTPYADLIVDWGSLDGIAAST